MKSNQIKSFTVNLSADIHTCCFVSFLGFVGVNTNPSSEKGGLNFKSCIPLRVVLVTYMTKTSSIVVREMPTVWIPNSSFRSESSEKSCGKREVV